MSTHKLTLRWHPHTEKPEGPGPMTALIATADEGEIDDPYLVGVYFWRFGAWHREFDDQKPLEGRFWWVPEEEILPDLKFMRRMPVGALMPSSGDAA